jgi:hypothetical protein
MAVPYAKQIELFEQPIALFKKSVADNKNETEALNVLNDDIKINETDTKSITIRLNQRPFTIPVDEDGHIKWLDKVIAGFIYYFETYPKSACKKSPLQRSLPIDENLILLVTEDDSDLGYQFTVGPCEGNFSDVETQVKN